MRGSYLAGVGGTHGVPRIVHASRKHPALRRRCACLHSGSPLSWCARRSFLSSRPCSAVTVKSCTALLVRAMLMFAYARLLAWAAHRVPVELRVASAGSHLFATLRESDRRACVRITGRPAFESACLHCPGPSVTQQGCMGWAFQRVHAEFGSGCSISKPNS